MINTKIKFHEDITRFLRAFSGIAAFSEEVAKIGSLEQAAAEAEARLQTARKIAGELEAERLKAVAKVEAEVEKIREAAKKDDEISFRAREELMRVAHKDAERIKLAATAATETLHAQAQAALARTNRSAEAAAVELSQRQNIIRGIKDEHAKLVEDIRKSRAQLDEINAELAAVRKRFG